MWFVIEMFGMSVYLDDLNTFMLGKKEADQQEMNEHARLNDIVKDVHLQLKNMVPIENLETGPTADLLETMVLCKYWHEKVMPESLGEPSVSCSAYLISECTDALSAEIQALIMDTSYARLWTEAGTQRNSFAYWQTGAPYVLAICIGHTPELSLGTSVARWERFDDAIQGAFMARREQRLATTTFRSKTPSVLPTSSC